MSKGLNQISDEAKRAAVAAARIKLNGGQAGMGTLAAMDWLGKPKAQPRKRGNR